MAHCTKAHSFDEDLRARGVRPTKRRLALLEALHRKGTLTADSAVVETREQCDRVTAYRTLHLFLKTGMVTARIQPGGGTAYELADHHTHLLSCVSCGFSEAVHGCFVGRAAHDALRESQRFRSVHGHALTLFGTCTRCM